MYSILKQEGRTGQIVHYLADVDQDLITIVDECLPGSTVEVLGEGSDSVHKYIKSPSNKWVLYEGTTEFVMPKNDAKVYTFAPEMSAPCSLDGTPISDYQSGIKVYDTGYVTGTSYNAKMISSTTQHDPSKQIGHFVIVGLDTPDGATSYDIYDGETNKAPGCTPAPTNDYIMVRIEALQNPEKVKVTYNNGKEFTFDFTGVTLA